MGIVLAVRAAGLAVVLAFGATAAAAETREQAIVEQLVAEGYGQVHVESTWLGRIRIVGSLDGRRREIVLHPTSGEVLRDFITPVVTQTAQDSGGDDDDDGKASASAVISVTVTKVDPSLKGSAKPVSPEMSVIVDLGEEPASGDQAEQVTGASLP